MNFNDIRRAALLLTAGVSIACSESPAEIDGSIPQSSAPVFSAEIANQTDDSRAYVDDQQDYYVLWEEGDRISVFYKGNKTPSSYALETGAGEQLATFKAAGSVTAGSRTTNCAVYPECAEATFNSTLYTIDYPMPAVQSYKQGRYAGLEPHMVAHCIEDEQFVFRTFAGYLALKLYTAESTPVRIKSVKLETPSGELISGTMRIDASELFTELDNGGQIVSGSSAVTLDCGDGVELSTNKDNPTLFAFALPVNVRTDATTGGYAGLKFTVTDTDGRTMEIATKRNIGVSRGRITTMAPKAFEPASVEEAIDLSIAPDGSQQPSNCYVVTKAGRYKFPVRYVSGDYIGKYENNQYVNASYDEVKWMWKTEGIEITDDDLEYQYDEATKTGYIYFTVKNFVPGNMSIVARDNSGTAFILLHNWHIWFVNDLEEIEMKGKGSKNYTLLDRNIGAITADINDPNSFGLLYQWGRKDPLYNNDAGINKAPEINSYWLNQTQKPDYFTWQFAKMGISWKSRNNYPMICSSKEHIDINTYDYYKNWFNNDDLSNGPRPIDGRINLLWADTKTDFDPCPVGYRVPSDTELFDIKANDTTYELETATGDKIKLPHQIMNWEGTRSNEPEGIIWTSKYYDKYIGGYYRTLAFGAYYYGASIKHDAQNTWIYDRTYAVPVRCIKQ